jgi:CRP/FNR family transcriptional regulator, cyclic AMP receptor protein
MAPTYLAKARGGTTKECRKKSTAFSQGSPADAAFYIEKGKVKLTVLFAREGSGRRDFGERRLLWSRKPGGAAASHGHGDRDDPSARSFGFKKEQWSDAPNEPALSELFMSYLLSRNVRIEEDLVDQLFNSSEKRLARILLLLTRFGKDGQHEPVVPRMSQEQVSEAGLHRI